VQESLAQRLRSTAFQRLALMISLGFCLLGVGAHPLWFSAAFLFQALGLMFRPRTQIIGWVLAAVAVSWFLFVGGYEVGADLALREHAVAAH